MLKVSVFSLFVQGRETIACVLCGDEKEHNLGCYRVFADKKTADDLKAEFAKAVKVEPLSDNQEMFLVTIGVCENHRRIFEDLSETAKNDRYCFLLQNVRDWVDCQVNQKKLF